jgi:hypothetical protein
MQLQHASLLGKPQPLPGSRNARPRKAVAQA